jgi:aminomethyltransferase
MPVDCAVPDTKLTVRNGDGTEIAATAQEMPFYDKDKSIRTAKG